MSLRILSEKDVAKILSQFEPSELLDMMSSLFEALYHGSGFVMPNRLSVDTGKQTALFMPAHVDNIGTTIKVVCVPHDGEDGLPGTTLVLDAQSGQTKAIVNARNLTAVRTAAGSNFPSLSILY